MTAAVLAALLLPAAESVLREVPYPPLAGMEPAVARQLADVRAQLEAASGPGRAAAYGTAGTHYHAYALSAPAEACYRNAEALAPQDYRWPYLLGVLLHDDNRLEEAAAALERSQRADRYYPALVRRAAIQLDLGDAEHAARTLEPARRHAPDDPALLMVDARLALVQGRHERALGLLNRALESEPRASRLHYLRGMAYRALGRVEEARAELALAGPVGLRPKDALMDGVLALRRGGVSYAMEGMQAVRAGDFEAAAGAYRRALELGEGERTAALVNLAAVETQLGQLPAAIGHLEEARRLDPGRATTLFNLGVLLARVGELGRAEAALAELARSPAADDEARMEWALVLLRLGRVDEAETALAGIGRWPDGGCRRLLATLDEAAGPAPRATRSRVAELKRRYDACPPAPR